MIKVINQGMQSVKAAPSATDESGAGAFKSMADTLDKVVADAAKVELTIPELQKHSSDYVAMAKDIARAARDIAAAIEAKDKAKLTAGQAAMDKSVRQESPLVDSINKFCQAQ